MNDKKSLFVLAVVVALAIGGWYVFGKSGDTNSKSSVKTQLNQGESIKLSSAPSGAYTPKEIRVKAGTKVKIEADTETLTGGMDTVIIDGYNVRKVIAPGDNIVEFVADKTGTFKMYCANGMGNGKLIVE
ncbi:MAG: hypothetical protein ACD_8C00090G0002 [uncultured bacterium]|nr:MAG: hypothetical protein ACD_8C00090G0002 [uncultured bacterium]